MSIRDDRFLLIYCCCVAAILGAVFGSFLNCAAWRIARGESFLKGHSRCPACGHALGLPDLVPVLSWVFLRGRCRHCGAKVSARYPLTELFFAAVSVACLLRFDLSTECLRNWVFLCCLFCLSLVDFDSYTIPDGCLWIALGVWIAALPFLRPGLRAILLSLLAGLVYGGGMLLVSLILDRVLKKESLGGGDIKLFAVVGLYLGIVGGLFAMMLACVFGLLFALLRKAKSIPFGPSISLASGLVLLYGEGLVNWYLSLLGLS